MENDPRSSIPEDSAESPSARSSVLDERGGLVNPAGVRGQVQQLNLLTSRLEEFLTRQLDRLGELNAPVAGLQGGHSKELDRMIDEFEQVRSNWEIERQSAEERLQQDAERLQAAWQDLETEQRQLLTKQAAMRTAPAATVAAAPVASPVGASAMYPSRSVTSRSVASPTGQRSGDAEMTPSHRAQVQFQQLRREMQKHAQRRNKR